MTSFVFESRRLERSRTLISKVLMFSTLFLILNAAAQESGGQTESNTDFAFQEVGEQIYANNCAACHQSSGEGIEGVYPTLVGSEIVVGDAEGVIQILLNGRGGMPSFASDLSNEEIAAVISYVRTSWGNEADVVTPEMVAAGGGEQEESSGRPGAAD